MAISAEHEAELTRALPPADRAALIELLTAVAVDQRLIAGVHPGFADPTAYQGRDEEPD